MDVLRNFTIRKSIIDSLRGDERIPPRSFSVSKLVACPRKTFWGMYGIKIEYDDAAILTFSRGRAHHEVLEVYRLKEVRVEKDGVRGDIDMIEERVTEIYTTNVGLKRKFHPNYILAQFPLKVIQLTAYCHMLNKTEGDLVVFYLMGDYTRPIKPELEVYTITFTGTETAHIWKGLLDKRKAIEDGLKAQLPPIEKGEVFECLNCPYKNLCTEFDKYEVDLV